MMPSTLASMKSGNTPGDDAAADGRFAAHWKAESLSILLLAAMTAWFLATSWRKWTDPIEDTGTQWFVFWRLSHGALLYHDVIWNYGPLSAWFDSGLFCWFGPGMMVLVASNLAVYGMIAALMYLGFRKAWGRLGAFAALTVFISVFSFSRLNAVGNYNFATPYANESTHGMLVLLVTVFLTVWWCRGPSRWLAFFLGLCLGLATVLKPEFMLTGAILAVTACVVRGLQRQRVGLVEYLVIGAGLALPTIVFTIRFAVHESFAAAFVDASQAWWQVLVHRHFGGMRMQTKFLGFDRPWTYALAEAKAAGLALLAIGSIWAAGWIANRPWRVTVRAVLILAAGVLVFYFRPQLPETAAGGWANGWLYVGYCFPGLMAVLICVMVARAAGELQQTGRVEEGTMMALALALAAGVMLARMPLNARIGHLGFYQAALAGMVTAAFMVTDVPRWTGAGVWGRRVAAAGSLASLGIGCVMIAQMSWKAHADQTLAIGEGRDRFYCDAPEVDETGSLVKWAVDYLKTVPAGATVCVVPEGAMINYLSRRTNPVIAARDEEETVELMRRTPPDYVIFAPRNLVELGITRYGAPGGPGHILLPWLQANYDAVAGQGGDPMDASSRKGVLILRHKPKAAPPPSPPKPVEQPAVRTN
jgi:hypothetical protein